MLYPEYIRSEFTSVRNSIQITDVKTNGYYKMRDKKFHMEISFVFFENGIFHYNTTLGTSDENCEYAFVYCGTYRQSGDTIHTTYMSNPSFNGGFTAYKFDFLVFNNGQIQPLCKRAIHTSANNKGCLGEEFFSTPVFTRLDIVPKSQCFLTEEDWFFTNIK